MAPEDKALPPVPLRCLAKAGRHHAYRWWIVHREANFCEEHTEIRGHEGQSRWSALRCNYQDLIIWLDDCGNPHLQSDPEAVTIINAAKLAAHRSQVASDTD